MGSQENFLYLKAAGGGGELCQLFICQDPSFAECFEVVWGMLKEIRAVGFVIRDLLCIQLQDRQTDANCPSLEMFKTQRCGAEG